MWNTTALIFPACYILFFLCKEGRKIQGQAVRHFKTASINESPQFSDSIILHQVSSFFSPSEKMEKKPSLPPSFTWKLTAWLRSRHTFVKERTEKNMGRECSEESWDFRGWASWLQYNCDFTHFSQIRYTDYLY